MEPILQVAGLEIKYHTREGVLAAVRDVSFEVRPGEIVGVVGESGCGKSTVASAMLRLLPPNGEISAGQICFKGRDLCRASEAELRKLRGKDLGMIFQDPMTSLNPVFTVEEQMLDVLAAHDPGSRGDRRGRRERIIAALTRVGIPDAAARCKAYPYQFSGGMRQRIMIAMTLLGNPSLIVADEPTSALDVTLEAQIVDLIRGLRDEYGTGVLYITHDLGVVAQLCDRVLVMYAGNIVEAGDTANIFADAGHPYTRALLRSHPSHCTTATRLQTIRGRVPGLKELPAGCKFAKRCDLAQPQCLAAEPPYDVQGDRRVLCFRPGVEAAVGADESISAVTQPATLRSGEADALMVDLRDLRTYFRDPVSLFGQLTGQKGGAVAAVDGVNLTLRRGEALALVGESGSGKTTLGRTILRLVDPTAGRVFVEGQEITTAPQSKLRPLRGRMQLIFQDPYASLSPRMRVRDLLLEPFRIHRVPIDGKAKVEELLEMVGLAAEQADKYPHQLSGGQARRVGIARALALHPDILVADEPTSGLDVSVAAGILNLLKDLREQFNLSYLLITHNLNVVSFIADRVGVMYLGRLVEVAGTRDLFARPQHPYTTALLSAIPVPDPNLRRQRILLEGEIPSPRNPPAGCHFHPRCRYAEERCRHETPLLRAAAGAEHLAACHFPERVGTAN
ncbi:MAG TPA: ABC transporter ATP-binding protein [Anaerolineae bacterium]